MSAIVFTYNQRYGSKNLAVTECENKPLKCYTWSIQYSNPTRANGVKIVNYRCTGCHAMRVKWKKEDVPLNNHPLPTMKADGITSTWIDSAPTHKHFCQPKNRSEVSGLTQRRSMLAELTTGTRETTSSAIVRTETKLLKRNGGQSQEYRQEARQISVANRKAISKAFGRAKKKHFPVIKDFADLMDDENYLLRCTERGSIPKHEKFGERLLLYGDNEMLLFFSPRQQVRFKLTKEIVGDGNFKYSPCASYQVYRIFGFVKNIHSTPLFTALLKKKDGKTYRKMWRKLAAQLDGPMKLQYAHFDNEPAVYKSFQRQFPDVQIKMCSFHVKQDLNRMVQNKGLAVEYRENEDVQDVVRMLGALQLSPPEIWNYSLMIIAQRIQEKFDMMSAIPAKLKALIDYFRQTWLSLDDFFALYGMQGQRTTNTAESYHGKLRHFFRVGSPLGEWIVNFKELQNAEEENASDVGHRRQPPRKQSQESAEVSAKIASAQQEFSIVLDQQAELDDFDDQLTKFLLYIGYLMGYSNRPARAAQDIEVEGLVAEPIAMELERDALEEEEAMAAQELENLFKSSRY